MNPFTPPSTPHRIGLSGLSRTPGAGGPDLPGLDRLAQDALANGWSADDLVRTVAAIAGPAVPPPTPLAGGGMPAASEALPGIFAKAARASRRT